MFKSTLPSRWSYLYGFFFEYIVYYVNRLYLIFNLEYDCANCLMIVFNVAQETWRDSGHRFEVFTKM